MRNTDLNQILDFLKSCGINIELINDAANNNIFLLCFSFTLLAFIALLSLININIYLLILYFSKHKKIVKLVSKRQITLILFNLYKNTRKMFLVSELVLLTFCIGSILYICSIILKAFIKVSFTFFS